MEATARTIETRCLACSVTLGEFATYDEADAAAAAHAAEHADDVVPARRTFVDNNGTTHTI